MLARSLFPVAFAVMLAAPAATQQFNPNMAPSPHALTCPDLVPTPVTFTANGNQLEGRFRVRNIGTGALNAAPWQVLIVATTRLAGGQVQSEQATVMQLAPGADSQTFTIIRPVFATATTTVEVRGVPGECSTANNRSVTRYSGS